MSDGAPVPARSPEPQPATRTPAASLRTRFARLLRRRRASLLAASALAVLVAGYTAARPAGGSGGRGGGAGGAELTGGGESAGSPALARAEASAERAVLLADGPDPVPLFGPRRMDALGGGTAVYVEHFVVETTFPGYTLRLENGAADGTGAVDSATVRLNGSVVFSPADFQGTERILEAAVTPSADNTLEVELASGSGYVTVSLLATPDPTYTIFGPLMVAKQGGGPTIVPDSFALPAGAAPPYRLHLINGAPDDSTTRVGQGHIELNGTQVITPDDLNSNNQMVLRTVELLAMNPIEVRLGQGPVGSFVTLRFTATDTTPPLVEITAPAEGTVVGDVEAAVTGTLVDQTATGVVVNGTAAAVAGNTSFSATAPLGAEGEHWLVAVATDAAGNEARDSVRVVRDTQAPALTVTAPPDGLITNADSVEVTGSVLDATETTVNVNGAPVPVDGAGGFSTRMALLEGENVITTTATDAGGNATSDVRLVVADRTAPTLTVTEPVDSTTTPDETIVVAGTVVDSTPVTVAANGVPLPVAGDGTFGGGIPLVDGENTITTTATDAAGNQSTDVRTVTRELPPDPSTVAPPVDSSVPTALHTATEFLYTGPDPIQTGVAPGTIEPARVAVLRGRLVMRDGSPLPGVTVTVLDQPEFGQTVSRADGAYDLAVNGGGPVTLTFRKGGYLPAQRSVEAPWQDYAEVADVMLLPLDTAVTTIDLTDTSAVQVARATVQTDADGPRQATLLFEPGTEATMVLPDGTEQPLTTLSVRATEYTVGEEGPSSMPAELPPTVAYTYAVELSVDEASAAGADSVRFSEPVSFYVENFLGFPVGLPVPVGVYDPSQGLWVPERNGRSIEILGDSAGLATIDINGDGAADDSAALATLGISPRERGRLATLYAPGDSLWRVELGHFSAIDLNYTYVYCRLFECPDPNDPRVPEDGGDAKEEEKPEDDPCLGVGSIIECENQTLGERIGVSGTPFTLNYRSDRVPGRTSAYTVEMQLSGDSVSTGLRRILFEVHVAGRVFRDTFPAAPNQRASFTWDGRDSYGREVRGSQPATVRVGYVYPFYYAVPPADAKSFGLSCTTGATWSGCIIPADLNGFARQEGARWREWKLTLGAWDARSAGLGGWTLDVHHAYDPLDRVLYRGDGRRRRVPPVIRTVAGTGSGTSSGDGGPATEAGLPLPSGVEIGPDGSVYVIEHRSNANSAIRRIAPDGTISTHAITVASGTDLALAPDGTAYVSSNVCHCIERITPDGTRRVIAGGNGRGFSGDGGPATAAQLNIPLSVAVGPDGSIYISDSFNHRIRRVGLDGIIRTIAGTGQTGWFVGEGGPATKATLYNAMEIAFGPDGSLYIADFRHNQIRRIGPDGIIRTIAGTGSFGYSGDGGPATEAMLNGPGAITVGRDGTVYIGDYGNYRIRMITPDGIISTFVGTGIQGYGGDSGPASRALIDMHHGRLAMAPDGSLYLADYNNDRLRVVAPSAPRYSATERSIASDDGSELYQFSATGRHLRTLDALTGAVRYTFGYNAAGHLVSITDADGLITTIERDASGVATALIAPFGQRTELAMDSTGYLARVVNPASDTVRLGYHPDGLLAAFTDPRGHASTFTYDSLGYLIRDEDAAGGFMDLARTKSDSSYNVVLATALGRTTRYGVEELVSGDRRRTVTDPAGLTTTSRVRLNGTRTTTFPDGTTVNVTESPDPRFGMRAPVVSQLNVTTPGGRSLTVRQSRRVTLSDPPDPLSLSILRDTIRVNGRAYASTYDRALGRITTTTPTGRTATAQVDSLGRVLSEQVAGIDTVHYTYDLQGRLETVAQATRSWSLAYDTAGLLLGITGPLGRSDSLFYDPAGRLTRQVLPDGREIAYGYDAAGNLTALAPPGRPAHTFGYTETGLLGTYTAPDAGSGPAVTTYSYDLDRKLEEVVRPDSLTIGLAYDSAGRLSALTVPRGVVGFAYSPTSGNLATVTTPEGDTLAYAYDGSLVTEERWAGTVSGRVGFTYDNDFRVDGVHVNGADTVTFSYDPDGLLVGAGALVVTRDPANGRITGASLDSLTTTFGYNGFGELAGDTAVFGDSVLFARSYTRDDLGRIHEVLETVEGVTTRYTYEYGPADRLAEVLVDSVSVASYEYDDNGNRLRFTGPGGTVTGSYDAQDRLLAYGDATYAYTEAGELREKVVGADTTRYTYDVLGNLLRVELPTDTVIEYVIDGRNRRVGKKVEGVLVQGFLYSGQLNPVAELDSTGAVVARFVYGTKLNVPDYMIRGGRTYRILTDHLGSVRLVVDVETGDIVQRMDYDAFGQVMLDTNPGFQPFGFAGGLYDQRTGLVRFGARDYNAYTGRWTLKDPIGFVGGDSNLYEYVFNSPVALIDPLGLQTKCPEVPLPPPGADLGANINEAGKRFWLNPSDAAWFYNQVRNHRQEKERGEDTLWDYKQEGAQYTDFGNFNFGATGAAMGFPRKVLRRGAGFAQERAGTSRDKWGNWWDFFGNFGDDPDDQDMIRSGYEYYKNRCHEICRIPGE